MKKSKVIGVASPAYCSPPCRASTMEGNSQRCSRSPPVADDAPAEAVLGPSGGRTAQPWAQLVQLLDKERQPLGVAAPRALRDVLIVKASLAHTLGPGRFVGAVQDLIPEALDAAQRTDVEVGLSCAPP